MHLQSITLSMYGVTGGSPPEENNNYTKPDYLN
jgi:hypothetical protein